MAQVVSKSELAGAGALIQGLGLASPVVLAFLGGAGGFMLGLVLCPVFLIAGRRRARSFACGECRNPVASAEVRVCPTCKTKLGPGVDPLQHAI